MELDKLNDSLFQGTFVFTMLWILSCILLFYQIKKKLERAAKCYDDGNTFLRQAEAEYKRALTSRYEAGKLLAEAIRLTGKQPTYPVTPPPPPEPPAGRIIREGYTPPPEAPF